MIKLPAREDGRWTVQYANEKLPDVIATKNVTFDKEGYVRLSKPTIAFYTATDDADFGMPVKFARQTNNSYMVVTTDRCFVIGMEAGQFYAAKDTSTNAPQGAGYDTHATIFNNELAVVENADIKTWDFDWGWTDQTVTLASTAAHPAVNFVSQVKLAVTDANNEVELYSTAYAAGTKLVIPSGWRVSSMAYNRGYLGIGTYDGRFQGNGYFFIWDGNTAAANYAYPINTNGVFTVIPYKDTFIIFTGNNQLLSWTGSGLTPLVNFPAYYDSGIDATSYASGNSLADSYYVDGDIFYLNRDGGLQEADSAGRLYVNGQPAGIWCFDPAVGMYHRHGTTGTKMLISHINEGDVNTTDNEITVTSAPETGTPVYYSSSGDTEIGGLSTGALYYTIKVDATTVKLASTYANAIAGTAIDLTSDVTDPVVLTSAVNDGTDRITISSSIVSGYGHPVTYHSNGGTEIAGLTDGTTYYVTGAYTFGSFQLASSQANALELSAIDLTGTGNDAQTFSINAHTLSFVPKSDFGQQYSTSPQGAVDVYDRTSTQLGSGTAVGAGLLYGSLLASTTTTEHFAGGMTLRGTENRGHIVTSKFQSAQLQDDWQKVFIKHSVLSGEFDEIHVKYRTREEDLVQVGFENDGTTVGGAITWTDSDTFTTTDTQYANVQAGDEVEVVQGAGSGYLLHVSSISETGGTYTVNLDESVKNISASDTARAIVSRWTKLTVLSSDTITNEDGYSEIAVGVKSKSIQFKVELRGEDVEIEEILVAHQLHKPVA